MGVVRQLVAVGPDTRIRSMAGNHRLHHKWKACNARKKRFAAPTLAIAQELAGGSWSLAASLRLRQHGAGH